MNAKTAMILGLGMLAVSSANAVVLFNQPYDNGNAYLSSSFYSSTVYDDFILSHEASVTTVDWTGVYTLNRGDLTGFTLDFWSDHAGAPGTLLAIDPITGLAGETATGTDLGGILPQYNYSATLGSSFLAAPGTEYYLSIVANTGGSAWYWNTSGVGNDGGIGATGDNLAFTLEGSLVPDGGTTAPLLGMAFIGLGFAKRKLR